LASFEQDCTLDWQRGRKEVRSLKVTTALNSYLQQDWPGVAQVAQLTRTVTVSKTAETTTEVVYLITTLTREQASPQRLLELVRGQWCIENRSHYVRDVTFQEDRSRLRDFQCSSDSGLLAQSGYYPYPSPWFFSDCFYQTFSQLSP
jgi:hypothetical protein